MYRNLVPRIPDNLRPWLESGAASRWVAAHAGLWRHQDWLVLLTHLGGIVPGNVEPEAVGLVLEALKVQWLNLSRWQASGEADRWVAAHQGVWHHQDWLTLLSTLRRTEFWPVNFEAVGLELEQARLRRRSVAAGRSRVSFAAGSAPPGPMAPRRLALAAPRFAAILILAPE